MELFPLEAADKSCDRFSCSTIATIAALGRHVRHSWCLEIMSAVACWQWQMDNGIDDIKQQPSVTDEGSF